MIDRRIFFSGIRKSLFSGRLGKRQVEGLNAVLNEWERTAGSTDLRQLAYILATAYHETAFTLQPIKERGGTTYLRQNYDINGSRPRLARANGNVLPGDGARYAGRGFVQLTWRNNYRRVGTMIGVDLEASPQLALQIDTAATILVRGMREGWFTGRKLSQYFTAAGEDWINARRIVNGLDRAQTLAGYAKRFLAALLTTGNNGEQVVTATMPPVAPVQPKRRQRRAMRTLLAEQPLASPYLQVPINEGCGQ